MTEPSNPTFSHDPVMVEEVVRILGAGSPGVVIDATVGGGGHARALLQARPDLQVLGIDRDAAAVEATARALADVADVGERVVLVQAGFDRLTEIVGERVVGERQAGHPESSGERASAMERDTEPGAGAGGDADRQRRGATLSGPVVGVLFDLGVSSPQIDVAERGFSYRRTGPLDMRMDRSIQVTAADLLNDASEDDLVRILRDFGEERFARPIARAVIRRRPLRTTDDLVAAVHEGIPARARRHGRHPARRTFQALRIAVNDELGQLERALDASVETIAPGGRVAVISYHSLEDRIVKTRFREWASGGHHPPGLPVQETERGGVVHLLTRRALRPSPEEIARNPRAESARLRAVERPGPPAGSAA